MAVELSFHPDGAAVAPAFRPCEPAFHRGEAAVELASATTFSPCAPAFRRDVAVVVQILHRRAGALAVVLGFVEEARIFGGRRHDAVAGRRGATEKILEAFLREVVVAAAVRRGSAIRVLVALVRSSAVIFSAFRKAVAKGVDLRWYLYPAARTVRGGRRGRYRVRASVFRVAGWV